MHLRKKDYPDLSKTKLLIIEAFFDLLQEDDFEKITVTQILQEADLARATFYINYKTKEDIVRSYIHSLALIYIENTKAYSQPSVYELAFSFFSFWIEKKEFLFLLVKNNLFNMLYIEFYDALKKVSATWQLDIIFEKEFNTSDELDLFCNFIASGLWSILRSWIENDMESSPNKIANSFVKFTM